MNKLKLFFDSLKNPEFLFLLIIPVFISLWYLFKNKKISNNIIFSNIDSNNHTKSIKESLRHLPFILKIISSILMIFALARPQTTTKWEESTTEGIDIILAIDISSSMNEKDLKPNRLESAKEVAKEYPRDREWQKLVRKHSRSIEKFQKTGNFDRKAEEELVSWAMDNGEIRTDDVDETDEWLHDVILSNSYIPEGEPIIENLLMEKPYDKADVKKVQKLEIQFEKLLKEVDKTIRGSGLSAPAFSMVRSGITKGLDAIKNFYRIANNTKSESNIMDTYRQMWEDTIVEKKEMNPKVIEKIAKLTDRNDHNESLLLLAKELKDREAIKLLGNIKDMHKVYGHMPQELIGLRNKVFDNLMRQSKSKYANHDDVYGAL